LDFFGGNAFTRRISSRHIKELTGIIIMILAAGITAATVPAPVKKSFADDGVFELNSNFVQRAPDGKSLLVDTTAGDANWKYLLRTRPGVLQPSRNYQVTFRCRVENPKEFFHILCRPLNIASCDYDTLRTSDGFSTNFKTVQLKFSSGVSRQPPAFQIHTLGKMRGELTDFHLTETTPDKYFPVGRKGTSVWNGNWGTLPTGAKEFQVDLPNNPSGTTVNAADFGVNADQENNTAALIRAIQFCKKTGAARLKLAPGVYRVVATEPVNFAGMHDFEFDGGGATLVYYGNPKWDAPCFLLENCERIAIRNLNFDWDWKNDPLSSIVKVEDVGPEHVDFRFIHYQRFPQRNVAVLLASNYDPAALAVGIENGITFGWHVGPQPKHEWLSDNLLRVHASGFQKGQCYRLQHRYYGGFCMLMKSNRHLTLEDVNIYSCYGMGIVVRGTQKYWQFRRVRITPPTGKPERVISCTADHYHVGYSCGFFKMEDCEFGYGGDDCVNAHDSSIMGRKSGPRTITTINCSPGRISAVDINDPLEVRNADFSPTGFTAPRKAVKTIDATKGIYELQFDRLLPEPSNKDGVFVIFNRKYQTRNVIIRNCYFHDNRCRGVLILCDDVTLENNRFKHNGLGAMQLETGYIFRAWSEGYGVKNVVVRNNVFDSVNSAEWGSDGWSRDIYIGAYIGDATNSQRTSYPILSDILFENNRFTNSFGLVAFIGSGDNIIFRNNIIENTVKRRFPLPYRGDFFVTNASNVKIVNNRWIASPYVPHPGIYAAPNGVKNLVTGGNFILPIKTK